jgi:hypothetical protein
MLLPKILVANIAVKVRRVEIHVLAEVTHVIYDLDVHVIDN